jgi:DNA replication protein DnaC
MIGELLQAEISESEPANATGSRKRANARSIKYQMAVAKLPLAKEVEEFRFEDTPINETLVRELAGGDFLAQQRNVVLIGDEPLARH